MLNVLDSVLLSKKPSEEFEKAYEDKSFREWLLGLLPEVEDCKNLKQDNPWHIYTCLEHILKSVEAINIESKGLEDSVRRMLAYTMFLHDIGKPECYIRRYSKLYGREVDSFFNHNKAGVKIACRVLGDFGFLGKEKEIITKLVDEHDVFMFITLEDNGNKHHRVLDMEYMRELEANLDRVYDGNTMLKYLLVVGRSDNLAQNPKMTGESLHKIDVMREMLSQMEREDSVQNK